MVEEDKPDTSMAGARLGVVCVSPVLREQLSAPSERLLEFVREAAAQKPVAPLPGGGAPCLMTLVEQVLDRVLDGLNVGGELSPVRPRRRPLPGLLARGPVARLGVGPAMRDIGATAGTDS
jgi:hypothetical protein